MKTLLLQFSDFQILKKENNLDLVDYPTVIYMTTLVARLIFGLHNTTARRNATQQRECEASTGDQKNRRDHFLKCNDARHCGKIYCICKTNTNLILEKLRGKIFFYWYYQENFKVIKFLFVTWN